ncbi:MAG: hypothetical protein AAGA54_28705 [Myxococcota bacterium]
MVRSTARLTALGALVLGLAACPRTDPAPNPAAAKSDLGCAPEVAGPTPVTSWSVEPRGAGGLSIAHDGTPVLILAYGGYGKRRAFAKPSIEYTSTARDDLTFSIRFETLPVRIDGHATRPSPTELRIDYVLHADQELRDIGGVGLEIRRADAEGSLSMNESGRMTASLGAHGQVALTFDPQQTRPRLFETPTHAIRAAWFEHDTPAGTTRARLTIELPSSTSILPPVDERYDPIDLTRWHADALVFDDWPVDLGSLNAVHGRAGSHGPLRVRGDALAFDDGTPARFWGTNVAARALFDSDDATIEREAQRLAALGYNLVRLHHHDAGWIDTNVFDTSGGTTQVLDADALDRLDRWIDALAERGIYVWVDLHTGRRFLPGDTIPGYDDMLLGPHPQQARGFAYINPRVEALQEQFAAALLVRKNPYTGRPWSKDPAIVAFQLTNENDITQHFAAAFTQDTGRDTHAAMFERLGREIVLELGLDGRMARRLRRPGDAKVMLAEMQHRWDARALRHLQAQGVRAPRVTTNAWGEGSMYNLPPLAAGDILDAHSYGNAGALSSNPHRTPNFLHFIAANQVSGMPMTVSEWALPRPAPDRHTAIVWAAAIGSLQGWDAMLAYNYAQDPLTSPSRHTQWDQRIDPGQLGLAPTAALAFRRGDVSVANTTVALAPSVDALWNRDLNPKHTAALRTAPEQSRVVIALPDHPKLAWDRSTPVPDGAQRVDDLDLDLLESAGSTVEADTGEIARDWAAGILRIDTPRLQAASGWIGGTTVPLGDIRISATTAHATIAAVALDARPLSESRRILVTAVARALPDPDAPGHLRSEPVAATVSVRGDRQLKLVPLHARSRATPTSPIEPGPETGPRDGWTTIALPTDQPTHWFLLIDNTP